MIAERSNRFPHMTALAQSFPCSVRFAHCIDPWDAEALDAERRKGMSHGEKMTAAFLLTVFNPAWLKFNLHEALGVWDDAHCAAFAAWAHRPWYA